MQQHSYMRKGALALAGISVGGYLAEYGFNLVLTRLMSAHAYGDFRLAFSFAYFCGLAVLLGGDRAAPMVLAPRIQADEPRRVWEYLRFYLLLGVLLGTGVIIVVWALHAIHAWRSGAIDPHVFHAVAWAVFAIPLNAAAAMISRTMQSAKRPAEAALPWRLGLPLLQVAVFGAIYTGRGSLSEIEAVFVAIATIAAITAWQWTRIRGLGLVILRRDPEHGTPRIWLAASLPMMGAFLVALALNQSDIYFLELLGDEAEVGHYSAASMAAHLLPMIQVTLIGLVAPVARPAIEAGAAASRVAYLGGLRWMLSLVLPAGLLLAFFGEWVMSQFGADYRVGHDVLRFLVLGNAFWAAAALSSLWLQYRGRGSAVLTISVITLLVDSLLNLLLIPRFGMAGAAGGTALTLTGAAIAVLVVHLRSAAPVAAVVDA